MPMQAILSQRLEQRLKMTAQMIQSIEMLQLPMMALEQQINAQLAENPALEIAEEEVELPDGAAERSEREEQGDFAKLDEISRDEEWEEALYSAAPMRSYDRDEDPKQSAMQNTAARPETLQEHLIKQIRLSEADARTREVAEALAYNLDDNGYLLVPVEEVFAGKEEPPAPVTAAEAAAALELIRSLDPAGVGAKSVEDCLILQMERREAEAPPGVREDFSFEKRLVREHFDDLLNNRLPRVAEALGVDVERVKRGIARIAQLNPRPGREFSPRPAQYVVPDIIIEELDGEYVVRMNETLPPLRISPVYRELLKKEKRGSPTREYLREKLQSAKWLIDSIAQRRNTLLKIANEIVRAQRGFLEHGVSHLKPLMMQDVASRIGMHVSTVSRAIADKYAETPQGLFPLRYFFTSGYKAQGADGDSVSNRTVMNRIAEIVKAEDKKTPLSDAEIASKLRAEGLEVARRTVAKYREKLGIPGSRQRKQY